MCPRLILFVCIGLASPCFAQEKEPFENWANTFETEVHPLIDRLCLDCHDASTRKGELDLERFSTLTEIRKAPEVWQQVLEQIEIGEMPPKKKDQPSREEKEGLTNWIKGYLKAEAFSRAGDPGPVVLRRLSNAEYTYSLRDLTGLPNLNPANQFPVDSAAGEGFTNTGDALVMSPALLEKYLDAGREVARHVVLLPDGIRFSPAITRRDRTDEIVGRIRDIYQRYLGGGPLDLSYRQKQVGDAKPSSGAEGRLNLTPYIENAIRHRDQLLANPDQAGEIAARAGINERYFQTLVTLLVSGRPDNPLFNQLRKQWKTTPTEQTSSLVSEVDQWREQLWKFNPVGHLGDIQPWQEPVDPIAHRRDFTIPLKEKPDGQPHRIVLSANTAGDGPDGDRVLWEKPRLERRGKSPILLRDLAPASIAFGPYRKAILDKTSHFLDCAAAIRKMEEEPDLSAIAEERELPVEALKAFIDYLGIHGGSQVKITDYLTHPVEKVGNQPAIVAWTLPGQADLSFNANQSDSTHRIPGEALPHQIVVHPRPERWVAAGWMSPVSGQVEVEAAVRDAHGGCGNGIAWSLHHQRGDHQRVLKAGKTSDGGTATITLITNLEIKTGDLLSLIIDARDAHHHCDLTSIDLTISEKEPPLRQWSLSGDCADSLLAGNPHPDTHGNLEVWHFYSGITRGGGEWKAIPRGSLLDQWLEAPDEATARSLAEKVETLVNAGLSETVSEPDAKLHAQMTSPDGALFARADFSMIADFVRKDNIPLPPFSVDPALFDEEGNLIIDAPSEVAFDIPTALFGDGDFVVTGRLHPQDGGEGSVQLGTAPLPADRLIPGIPLTVHPESQAEKWAFKDFETFRQFFPLGLCYGRVVPIDEVVTLVLFHREDEHLKRLMLSPEDAAELDQLWSELRFVSQEAFQLETALEQILEFATQDADPSKFFPLRTPIADKATRLKEQRLAAQPSHLDSLIAFATRAYRRPLTPPEEQGLRKLHQKLIDEEEMPHAEALSLTLARVLSSPAFLYKAETPSTERGQGPVSPSELATRLSYFLTSSGPDAELHRLASSGALLDPATMTKQADRLRQDPRIRRLAIEFACQWLHIQSFDQFDEKSETHFPEFKALRANLYEEAIRFFTDFFQNDRSILSLLEADHSFANASLSSFYGMEKAGEEFEGWQKVEGMRNLGRGGILGMGATLARHSGASRTSPILRGIWVSETLLGEKLPSPPAAVPPLPETTPAGLTERQLIERHSSDPACAKCHQRIDPYGFALEQFNAIGARRNSPTNTRTELPDGTRIEGLEGLRRYLGETQRDRFVRQFCRKLLGYALGRAVQLSDEPFLDELMDDLESKDYRVGIAIDAIVQCRQFREIRGRDGT